MTVKVKGRFIDPMLLLRTDGPIAVKFQLVFPSAAFTREGVGPQKEHRIDEAALHFGSHQASLADG